MRRQAQEAGFEELAALARLARSHQPDLNDPSALHHWAAEIVTSGAQATLLRSDGQILADSSPGSDVSGKDPEIQQALSIGEGRSIRHSTALNRDVLYYAVADPATPSPASAVLPGTSRAPVLRLALPLPDVDQH